MILNHLASWDDNPQNLHLHLPHQVQRLGARVEVLDWVFSEVSLSSRVLEVSGLRIRVVFKRARWVKSRFSLNLARWVTFGEFPKAVVSHVPRPPSSGNFLSGSPRCLSGL
ncbi:hypothetical protein L6452_31054 [Arctium lappa]|uniref:Uncharacterized protein n=1 Tax=Arctium lappa TaxID=4217 RepID=A0ACB8ZK05_ARCLA|nr:hypothetical protein L6452_31054 [Arctium lappa]